jgi:hypothetical protein
VPKCCRASRYIFILSSTLRRYNTYYRYVPGAIVLVVSIFEDSTSNMYPWEPRFDKSVQRQNFQYTCSCRIPCPRVLLALK